MRLADLATGPKAVAKATASRGIFDGSEKTHCELKQWWFAFQSEAAKLSIPLRVVWGWRSFETQDKLWRKGTGAPPGQSAHNFGMALDIIHTRRGWAKMPAEGWVLLGTMGMEIARKRNLELRWGGDWNRNGVPVLQDPKENFWDAAHFEMNGWKHLTSFPCTRHLCNGECLPAWEMDFPEKAGKPGVEAVQAEINGSRGKLDR